MSRPTVMFSQCPGWPTTYRVDFDYDPAAVKTIKASVPWHARSFDRGTKTWTVRTAWAGALMFALRAAGLRVHGLNEGDIEEWFAPFAAPPSSSETGRADYTKGLCRTCGRASRQAGGTECQDCFHRRLVRQYRVRTVLAEKGLAPWPVVEPSKRKARHMRMPVEIRDESTDLFDPSIDNPVDLDEAIANVAAVLGGRIIKETS